MWMHWHAKLVCLSAPWILTWPHSREVTHGLYSESGSSEGVQHNISMCLCDPACPWPEISCLFISFLDWQTVGHSWYLNYCAILNILSYICRAGQCDGMATFGLEDYVFEGGTNTNHKVGEDQVVCVLHSWVQLARVIEGLVTLPAGQIWAVPAPAVIQRVVDCTACSTTHCFWCQWESQPLYTLTHYIYIYPDPWFWVMKYNLKSLGYYYVHLSSKWLTWNGTHFKNAQKVTLNPLNLCQFKIY